MKNLGSEDLMVVLFFGSNEEVKSLDVDEAFFGTPEDIAARALQPSGGVKFIRTFQKFPEAQSVNLPPNLGQLVHSVNYQQSEDTQVWRYFYDLGASPIHPFQGGQFQWAPYRSSRTSANPNELIYIRSLNEESRSLTLATLRIFVNELGQPHYHFNANELAYVVSGCARAGLVMESGKSVTFDVAIGDVIFFPVGTQHYLKSVCDEELLLVVAYSTGKEVRKGFGGGVGSQKGKVGSQRIRIWQLWVRMGSDGSVFGSDGSLGYVRSYGSLFGSYGGLWGLMDPYLAAMGLYGDQWIPIWQLWGSMGFNGSLFGSYGSI
uniref:Cupin type-1 domain-containing protein n=2 Tax=Phasianus colchicus TaxID=9054 RepID=A0A669QH34_PHACC